MASRKRFHPNYPSPSTFLARKQHPPSGQDTDESVGCIPPLQELIGDMIRNQVAEERKEIIQKHSEIFDNKRYSLEVKREELQQQLRELEDQMKLVEIECHEDMLTELDEFDNERQPEMLNILTDTGQLDRICPLCENFFRSSTELPECCLGPEHCHLHMVQRCCFSCSRLNFHDIFQCLAVPENENRGKLASGENNEDHDNLENTASTPPWVLDEILEEAPGSIREEDEDEYQETAATLAMAALELVPSDHGSVKCPVCQHQYCDHDFLYHFAACCRQAQTEGQSSEIHFECNE